MTPWTIRRLGHQRVLLIFVGVFATLECLVLFIHETYVIPYHRNAVVVSPERTILSAAAKPLPRIPTAEDRVRRPTFVPLPSKRTLQPNPSNNTKQKKKNRGWDPGAAGRNKPPTPLKVTTPIWVVSLPKSGTTSLWQYFQCGSRTAAHQWTKFDNGTSLRLGMCMRQNIQKKRALFENCGDYDVYIDTGYSLFVKKGVSDCYLPSMTALPQFYESYPTGTLILMKRNTTAWYQSMQGWGGGSLLQRWRNCNVTTTATADSFYEQHNQHIRDFARHHPSLTFLEIALESPNVGHTLEKVIGIHSECWGKCRPDSKFCEHVGR